MATRPRSAAVDGVLDDAQFARADALAAVQRAFAEVHAASGALKAAWTALGQAHVALASEGELDTALCAVRADPSIRRARRANGAVAEAA